jgi:hypothetical protein
MFAFKVRFLEIRRIAMFSNRFVSECPRSNDRMERFACPSPDFRGRFRCIDDRALCDGFFDCPGREDENPDQCLFYKTVSRTVSKSVRIIFYAPNLTTDPLSQIRKAKKNRNRREGSF